MDRSEALHRDILPCHTINARTTDRDAGLDELAAQIKAKGLIQPIVVRPAGKGKYQIIAGNRRHAAIGKLIAAKDWPERRPVPIVIRDEDDAGALETSLIENVGRLPMHPVDQYEAFAALQREDKSATDIAATFGIPEQQVKRRLALGSLAAEIRKAWRDEKLDANTAQAFAICPDKQLQAKIFKELTKKQHGFYPHDVRKMLVNDRPKLDDPRVAFVGLERYRAAGGAVVENLFESDGYLEDGALLKQLVAERLKERCDELVAEGWSFAVPASEFELKSWEWRTEDPKPKYTPEQKSRVKAIEKELDQLEDADDYDYQRMEELEQERDAIDDAAKSVGFTKAQKAKTGCILDVSTSGVEITYGVYPVGAGADSGADEDDDEGAGSGGKSKAAAASDDAEPTLSGVLIQEVTKAQTEAAANVVATEPEIALTLAIAALSGATYGKAVDIHMGHSGPGRHEVGSSDFSRGLKAVAKLSVAERMQELARLIAASLDLVATHPDALKSGTDELVAMLPGDKYLAAMRGSFDAADFFTRASGKIAIAALHEMGETGIRGGRKSDLADTAAKKAKETGWLPERLRHPDYALIGAQPKKGKGRKAA